MKNVLIDANIYSLAMKGDKQVIGSLRRLDRIGFSAISIGELFSGFKGGSRENKNRQELELFLDSPRVVVHVIDEGSADFYAAILNNLRAAGTPIPTNDIWIAATAFQHGYKLYSKDEQFRLIPGLVQFRELQG
jgi:tRNA(fMet)-specific endonuclease VapC